MARAADQAFGLALRVAGIRQSRVDLAEVADQLGEDWALFPLVHDDGSVGVMALDPACVIAFVEQQTLGRVASTAAENRKLTRTDKALAHPFLGTFLNLFDDALEGAPTAFWTRGYRAEDALGSRHLMVLQLDGSEYRGFAMSAECVETGHKCEMQMFLPIKDQLHVQANASGGAKQVATPKENGAKLSRSVLPAQIEMNAVMCRLSMPLSALRALEPGQLIPLPRDAGHSAKLEDSEGRTSLPVRLGQLHGLRAIRLRQETSGARSDHADQADDDAPLEISESSKRAEPGRAISAQLPETDHADTPQKPGEEKARDQAPVPAATGDELDALLSPGVT